MWPPMISSPLLDASRGIEKQPTQKRRTETLLCGTEGEGHSWSTEAGECAYLCLYHM